MIYHIVAADVSGGIGLQGQLIDWRMHDDLKHFKETTQGSVVVMGRVTFESIAHPLPNRINIVVSETLEQQDGIVVCNSVESAMTEAAKYDKDIYIIGGESIYTATADLIDSIIYTLVIAKYKSDVYYPTIDLSVWKEQTRKKVESKNNKHASIIFRFVRK